MACDEWILIPRKVIPKKPTEFVSRQIKSTKPKDIPLKLIYLHQLRKAFEKIKIKDINLGTGIL